MTPRPLYRWKSYWLGIFVVGFLAWAWRDSLRFESCMNWPTVIASNAYGAVHVSYASRGTGTLNPEWRRMSVEGVDSGLPVSRFPPPMLVRGEGIEIDDLLLKTATQSWGGVKSPETYQELAAVFYLQNPPGDWLVLIPHWLILLGFLVPWAGFLIWKGRRAGNLTKAS